MDKSFLKSMELWMEFYESELPFDVVRRDDKSATVTYNKDFLNILESNLGRKITTHELTELGKTIVHTNDVVNMLNVKL